MSDLETLKWLMQTVMGGIVAAATLMLAIWLWRDTRRPKSLFTESDGTSPTVIAPFHRPATILIRTQVR